jgi:hypothetical protein
LCFKTKAHVQKSRESTRSWLDGQGWEPEKRVQGKGWEWKRKGDYSFDDFLVFVSQLQNTVHIQKNQGITFFLGWLDPSFIDVYMKFPPKNKPSTNKFDKENFAQVFFDKVFDSVNGAFRQLWFIPVMYLLYLHCFMYFQRFKKWKKGISKKRLF